METTYLEVFNRLRKHKGKSFVLRGNNILIEIVEEEIKTKSGIILTAKPNQVHGSVGENKGLMGVVLEVGEGYYDEETGETIPLDVNVGDIVLLPKYSVSLYSTFPGINAPVNNKLAMCLESEIKMIFKGQEGYETAKSVLNA